MKAMNSDELGTLWGRSAFSHCLNNLRKLLRAPRSFQRQPNSRLNGFRLGSTQWLSTLTQSMEASMNRSAVLFLMGLMIAYSACSTTENASRVSTEIADKSSASPVSSSVEPGSLGKVAPQGTPAITQIASAGIQGQQG